MAKRSITVYLQGDHDQMDGLLADYQACKARDAARARRSFEEFQGRLRWHLMWEEDVIFPLFERKGGDRALTSLLRAEHQRIAWELRTVYRQIVDDGPAAAEDEVLLNTLAAHAAREDDCFYSELDTLLSEADIEVVFASHPVAPVPATG